MKKRSSQDETRRRWLHVAISGDQRGCLAGFRLIGILFVGGRRAYRGTAADEQPDSNTVTAVAAVHIGRGA